MAKKTSEDKTSVVKKDTVQEDIKKKKKAEEAQDVNPEEINEFLDEVGAPPEIKRIVRAASFGYFSQRSGIHPLFDKFTPDHITQYLGYLQRDDDNAHQLKKTGRWFTLGYILIAVALFIFLLFFLLPSDTSTFQWILTIIITALGGLGGGYGLHMRNK